MPFEFEALVGHLYIVGGRAISTAPPGALVEMNPRKAARGRETDMVFALVTPAGDSVAPASFYENITRLAVDRFFESSGSVTAGLREVFNTLNEHILDYNKKENCHYEVNIVCAALRGSDLIVGRVGAAVVLHFSQGLFQSFPEELTNEQLYTTPLGGQAAPNTKLTQYHVVKGTRVIFADKSLAEFSRDLIHNAMLTVGIGGVLAAFKDLARLQMSLIAVEFVPPDIPTEIPVPTGESTAEIAAKLRAETARKRETAEIAASPVGKRRARRDAASQEMQRRTKRGVGQAALGLANSFSLLNRMMTYFLGTDEGGGRSWLSSPLGAGTIVLLPLIIVVLVVGLWISRTGSTEFEICAQGARERVELARSVVNNDRQTVMNAWQLTLEQVDRCVLLRPGDPEMVEIRREGQAALDGYNGITRLEARIVTSIEGQGATLSRIVYQEPDLYVLDSTNGVVYRVSLSDDLMGISGLPVPFARTGGTVSNITLGEIIDITYNTADNVLLVLDRNGVLVECSPQFIQCTAQRLLGVEESWINPVAMTTWQSRIYLLDTGVGEGQIWRYDRNGGNYQTRAREYFDGSIRPNIRSGVDVKIDEDGNVYVLLAEGKLNKFFSSEAQDFGFAAFPDGQALTNATSLFIDDGRTSRSVYIVNQARRNIYETTFLGTWQSTYAILEEARFNLLSAVVVGPGAAGTENIYAVSGNTIFVLNKG